MFVDSYYKHFGGTLIFLLKSEVQNDVLFIYVIKSKVGWYVYETQIIKKRNEYN